MNVQMMLGDSYLADSNVVMNPGIVCVNKPNKFGCEPKRLSVTSASSLGHVHEQAPNFARLLPAADVHVLAPHQPDLHYSYLGSLGRGPHKQQQQQQRPLLVSGFATAHRKRKSESSFHA
jgi:hypothetical protein